MGNEQGPSSYPESKSLNSGPARKSWCGLVPSGFGVKSPLLVESRPPFFPRKSSWNLDPGSGSWKALPVIGPRGSCWELCCRSQGLECVWNVSGKFMGHGSNGAALRQKACNALRIWWGGCKGCVVSESACVDTILWMQSLLAAIVAQCCSDHGH